MSFCVAGIYLEACNCEAICPCRRIDGVAGGRSTHGVCFDGEVRTGDAVHLRATTPFETESSVSCIVPGHDRPGVELVNDRVVVDDPQFFIRASRHVRLYRRVRLLRLAPNGA